MSHWCCQHPVCHLQYVGTASKSIIPVQIWWCWVAQGWCSCKSYYSRSLSLHGDILLIAGCCSGYLPSQRYTLHHCIWTGTIVLFCWIITAQKTAVPWDQILVSLHVDPQQKMAISAALAHCSFFETGLVTVWNGMLRKQSTSGAQKRNSAPTVLPSVWSLAPWHSSAAGVRLCKTHWGKHKWSQCS